MYFCQRNPTLKWDEFIKIQLIFPHLNVYKIQKKKLVLHNVTKNKNLRWIILFKKRVVKRSVELIEAGWGSLWGMWRSLVNVSNSELLWVSGCSGLICLTRESDVKKNEGATGGVQVTVAGSGGVLPNRYERDRTYFCILNCKNKESCDSDVGNSVYATPWFPPLECSSELTLSMLMLEPHVENQRGCRRWQRSMSADT